ncbi:hypothetical protein LA080_012920 [Diaporthe eres]|nr:hypothetical protein LA080_012920 [Diaporthe eres]
MFDHWTGPGAVSKEDCLSHYGPEPGKHGCQSTAWGIGLTFGLEATLLRLRQVQMGTSVSSPNVTRKDVSNQNRARPGYISTKAGAKKDLVQQKTIL